ncbi:MAG: hypothetical protein WCO69_00030 [Candidatus Omnitrophota bacterium]
MNNTRAQAMIEFCFACIVLMVLVFGMIQTVRWSMVDLAERRYDHEQVLTSNTYINFGGGIYETFDVEKQLNPNFHQPRPIDAALFKK